ncbi:MAG TPA: ROK family protein [Armatimonadota bacterium]|nr:ROK family protein [Armatimonadota bacterium]
MAGEPCAIGVDLGGTNLRWAVVNERGDRIYQDRVPRPHEVGDILQAIRMGIHACLERCPDARSVGVAVPGVVMGEEVTSNNLGWQSVHLRRELGDLGVPLIILNDMAAGAVGELHCGRARGMRNVVFLTISTGIGAGIILDGKVYRGAGGLAGEVGHTVVDLNGLLCGCGRRGCWEMIASGTAHRRRIREAYTSGTWPNLEHEPTPTEVTERARHGDRAARALVLRTARYLGIGVANLANLYDPEAVIFTGGFARNNWDIIHEYLVNEVRDQAFSQSTQLLLTELGDDAGLVGAGAMALRHPGA